MEGREEGKGLRLLEQMLHSDTFKRAQKVCSVCTIPSTPYLYTE